MQQESVLRAVANRLTVTPVEDLPRIAGLLAAQLADCSLNSRFADGKASNASVAVHKLRTRINSLLQEKSIAGRFTGVVLVKAAVDNGGENVLRASESWARGLLNCINKPDTVEVKTLYLVALTRIFVLTQDDPALVREITTPLLPTFIKTTLNLIRPTSVRTSNGSRKVASPMLTSVLTCWIRLLPRHASVFRPFLKQLRPILLTIIADGEALARERDLAIQLLCWLLWSVPKNAIVPESISMFRNLINAAHATVDKAFRAVVEEYESNDATTTRVRGRQNFAKDPKQTESDSAGLPPWTGIQEGSHRLRVILEWLTCLLSVSSAEPLSLPIGALSDLTTRLMAITVPSGKAGAINDMKYHEEASKDEKEELWVNLPEVHKGCLRLLAELCSSLGQALFPLQQTIVGQILDLFASMSWHESVRSEIYSVIGMIMKKLDISALESHRAAFLSLLERCCDDLKTGYVQTTGSNTTPAKNDSIHLGSNVAPNEKSQVGSSCKQPDVVEAAWMLLSQSLKYYPATSLSRHIRTEMDRTAVLLDHKDAMLASILNPVLAKDGKVAGASLLPFLVRSMDDNMVLDALLRPRMPVLTDGGVQVGTNSTVQVGDAEENESDGLAETDVLAHLEQSVAEQQNEDARALEARVDEVHITSRLEDNKDVRAQKRSIDALETEFVSDGAHSTGYLGLREPKKSRSEALSEEVFTPTTEDTHTGRPSEVDADTEHLGRLNTQPPLWQAQGPESPSYPVSDTTAPKQPPQDDSDSDDSEIPTIDPELDTDEDEEML
ncbi:hypothetical protein PV08_01089 [Exophiala spinifera]|uniref:Pre-rRNA-processing protein RIX1 n=1 Tax=Exophiala spinifera TaxID=91928 RepID=A0A0D2CAD8_9EURO|nr:uncharacterized protein PV08_01089 [Exophiala spinifera]KIW20514.1 hypothetical protein PV08_01089 [Exophiala spinifera]